MFVQSPHMSLGLSKAQACNIMAKCLPYVHMGNIKYIESSMNYLVNAAL